MGTTATMLRTSTGPVYCHVLAVEGYAYLLTDHGEPAAVVTAWTGTEWSSCLPGLRVGGPFSQRFEPWKSGLNVQTLQVSVVPDEDDIFGRAVFAAKGAFNTRLTETFKPAADGSGTLHVKSTAGFDSGVVHVGGQQHAYSAAGAGAFTIGAGGANVLSPFEADGGNRFAKPATHPQNVNFDAAAAPRVTSHPTRWIGRKVALYIHRIVDGVLDVRAQAVLEFAGRIRDIGDAEDGSTTLELEDLRALIRDATLLDDQWTGYVKHGIRLVTGTRFYASQVSGATSGHFLVVASGASGADEIDAGIYDVATFTDRLTAWLVADGSLTSDWSVAIKQSGDAGQRTFISAKGTWASFDNTAIHFHCTNRYPLEFLGFTELRQSDGVSDNLHWFYVEGKFIDTENAEAVSDRAPYRAKFLQNRSFKMGSSQDVVVTLDTSDGTFFDQREWLPPGLAHLTTAGESWSVLQVGNAVYLARLDSPTQLSSLTKWVGPLRHLDEREDDDADAITVDDESDKLPVRQCLLLSGSFTDVVTCLLASIPGGENGVNHEDYDLFPWGAGMPWSLLGDSWLDSCAALEHSQGSRAITTLVTEPTRLLDLIVPELVLRFVWLRWKDEGYELATLPSPNALSADHVLDETNKAEPAEAGPLLPKRTTTRITNEFLRNIVKLEYARDASGKYRRTLTVKDQASITEHGGSAAKTIPAISSFGQEQIAGASVEELAVSLISRVFPRFAQPLWTLTRSIAPTLFHAVPGDTVRVSDDFARDPTSGVRGVTNRAGVVLAVTYDRGSQGGKLFGEVEILLGAEDRHYPMAPAAEIDATYSGTLDGLTFTNGYAAAGPAIKLRDHAYSRSSDAKDVTRFVATDLLRIVRLDSASGDAWSRTAVSVDATDGYLVLSATLASPAFTAGAAERYRVQPREYSACTDAQKLTAFQADDDDDFIEDLAEPNTYGEEQWQAFGASTLSELPILPVAAEYWGDGKPFHAGLLHDISLFNNNLPNYRTAPNSPVMVNDPATTAVPTFVPMLMVYWPIGLAATAGLVRKLYVAPLFRSTNAGSTVAVRVTSSALPPKAGLSPSGLLAFEFQGPVQQATFTTTSTTLAEATPQSIIPVRALGAAGTWLTVEIYGSAFFHSCVCYGLSRCYLGPLEWP